MQPRQNIRQQNALISKQIYKAILTLNDHLAEKHSGYSLTERRKQRMVVDTDEFMQKKSVHGLKARFVDAKDLTIEVLHTGIIPYSLTIIPSRWHLVLDAVDDEQKRVVAYINRTYHTKSLITTILSQRPELKEILEAPTVNKKKVPTADEFLSDLEKLRKEKYGSDTTAKTDA